MLYDKPTRRGFLLVSKNQNRIVEHGLESLFRVGSLTGVTDGQLLERFARRDGEASESAFAALVQRHGPLVWSTCRAILRHEHDAGDAFQATFLVLVRKASSLWVRDSIGPWLHRVALRAAIQTKREKKRRQEVEHRAFELATDWTDLDMPDDTVNVIHQEIDRLPERHRTVVVLCDIQERTHDEAARQLRCPVGTVKSRLARARERLQDALRRRGIAPAVISNSSISFSNPPPGLAPSTIQNSLLFATDFIKAASGVSKSACTIAEGVLKVMILAKWYRAMLGTAAATGLVALAWLAHEREAVANRPQIAAPATDQKSTVGTVDLDGNWIVRGYPSGQAFGLIKIEGPRQQAHATLLSITMPEFYRFAESRVDGLRIDDSTIRFTLRLQAGRPVDSRTAEVVAYLPANQSSPKALWGSMGFGGQGHYPAKLERTDRNEIDRQEGRAPAPGNDELRRFNQTKDPAKQKEILLGMLDKFGDTPMAPIAAWALAITEGQARASEKELRALIDQAARLAARYGPAMEVDAINVIVKNLIGMPEREELVLDYARKAVSMLRPTDPTELQQGTLKNLVTALRKATKIDEAKATAEADALDDRIANLGAPADDAPTRPEQANPRISRDHLPWARNYATASKEAKAAGKLIMVDFYTETCGWCKRLDSDVFPRPEVAEAMRPFVAVKVNAEDGEGRPLVDQYQAHIRGFPAILFLDPSSDDPKDARIVGKIPGFAPPACFIDQLNTIAGLPTDIRKLHEHCTAHPNDMNGLRTLVTALTMQGQTKEAIELVGRAIDANADPIFDRWSTVYNTLGDELMLRIKLSEAAEWYNKAARVAKRPVDLYSARLGAGFVAALERKGDVAAKELEAAARVPGVARSELEFAKELLGMLVKPLDGSASVREAAVARARLDASSSRTPSDKSLSTKKAKSSTPE
jgi:RNA polymerase sigma factor (sigma-70 family)